MKNLKYLVIVLAVIVAAWLLPAFCQLLLPYAYRPPFVIYSCLDSTFIRFESQENKQMRYVDFRGREFSKAEADSLLPLFSYRQLLAEGRLPDSLYGIALTPKLIQQNAFHFKTSPKQLNKPAVGLYTMFESASGNVDLTLPPDVFRLTKDGIEFVDCETNTVNRAKSLSFSRELTKHGFIFPVRLIWGNGSTRKDYDNGFLLTDANDQLFQLKMVKGMPYVRKCENAEIVKWKNVFTLEPANRKLIGLAVSEDNRLFAVRSDATLAEIGIQDTSFVHCTSSFGTLSYNPQEMQITIVGDLLHWTVTLYTATDSRYYAVDADDFHLVAAEVVPDPQEPLSQRLMRWLLPLRLHFTSWQTQMVKPSLNDDF
ncbi:MAG: DUF4857 domain-containing protein [Paludibacteraceae bacterium]|nr:DUF4857 domain-containing protein [Paludibacteraceae bacterium]